MIKLENVHIICYMTEFHFLIQILDKRDFTLKFLLLKVWNEIELSRVSTAE